jgi:small redox-active disulfide protein 2
MNRIEVLGSGCARCKALEEKVRRLVAENELEYQIEKVTDLKEIMKYGILSTPGLVVNGKVKHSGSIPTDAQILTWLMV